MTEYTYAEEWRPVLGWEGFYEVSDQGNVRGVSRISASGNRLKEKELSPYKTTGGYWSVRLCRDSQSKQLGVHALVLEAFVGPRPEGMEGCHNDGDTDNNTVGNLRWDTPSSNSLDRVKHGTHNLARKTECKRGHRLSGVNLYQDKTGRRHCRACAYAREKVGRNPGEGKEKRIQMVADMKYGELNE